jgi:hypothetical protein
MTLGELRQKEFGVTARQKDQVGILRNRLVGKGREKMHLSLAAKVIYGLSVQKVKGCITGDEDLDFF